MCFKSFESAYGFARASLNLADCILSLSLFFLRAHFPLLFPLSFRIFLPFLPPFPLHPKPLLSFVRCCRFLPPFSIIRPRKHHHLHICSSKQTHPRKMLSRKVSSCSSNGVAACLLSQSPILCSLLSPPSTLHHYFSSPKHTGSNGQTAITSPLSPLKTHRQIP